jgi:hypothetical protein
MRRATIATGAVHFVLPLVEKVAAALIAIVPSLADYLRVWPAPA